MNALWAIFFLSTGHIFSYEITQTHALAFAASALWTISARMPHQASVEYELSGTLSGALLCLSLVSKKREPLELAWKPSFLGITAAATAGFLVAFRTKSPLPYTIAALALLRGFHKKNDTPQTIDASPSPTIKRDLHYWIGVGLATGAFTIYQSVADAFSITDSAARGSMLVLSAIFLGDALQKQYGM